MIMLPPSNGNGNGKNSNGDSESNKDNWHQNGKFAKGNKYGKGNPDSAKIKLYRKVLLKAVKPQDIIDVFKMLVKEAKGGDIQAAKVLLDRCIGPVQQIIELSSPDGGGVHIYLPDNSRSNPMVIDEFA